MVKVTGITWGGTRTDKFDETVAFFRDKLGLEVSAQQSGFTSLAAPSGDKFEVFSPEDQEHSFMTTGPVIGFGVDDVDAARAELEGQGVEFIGETQSHDDYKWAHFRGPDGNVYEISSS